MTFICRKTTISYSHPHGRRQQGGEEIGVCMYVYICVCICEHVCLCVCLRKCVCVCAHICVRVCGVCERVYVHARLNTAIVCFIELKPNWFLQYGRYWSALSTAQIRQRSSSIILEPVVIFPVVCEMMVLGVPAFRTFTTSRLRLQQYVLTLDTHVKVEGSFLCCQVGWMVWCYVMSCPLP